MSRAAAPAPLPLHLYTPDQLRRLGVALHLLARGLERVRAKQAAAAAKEAPCSPG